MIIFFQGAFLEKEFATRIEDQDVDRAMFKPLPMNLAARELADDFITIVYDVKNFVLHDVA